MQTSKNKRQLNISLVLANQNKCVVSVDGIFTKQKCKIAERNTVSNFFYNMTEIENDHAAKEKNDQNFWLKKLFFWGLLQKSKFSLVLFVDHKIVFLGFLWFMSLETRWGMFFLLLTRILKYKQIIRIIEIFTVRVNQSEKVTKDWNKNSSNAS